MNRQLKGFGRKKVSVIGRFYSSYEQGDKNAPNLFGHLNCCRFLFRMMRAESIVNFDEKAADTVNEYDKQIKFAPHKKLAFADLTLEYTEDFEAFRDATPAGKNQLKHFFRIAHADKTLVVWISEDAPTRPLEFNFKGAKYQLETGIHDQSGKLAKDEPIVRKIN